MLYVPSATGTINAPGTLSFDYSYGGLTVHKTFHFDSSYVIDADVSVTQNGAPVAALLAWPSGLGDQTTLQQYAGATSHTRRTARPTRPRPRKWWAATRCTARTTTRA